MFQFLSPLESACEKVLLPPVEIDIDTAVEGPVYGNLEGLQRVKQVEAELHQLKIRKDHPRIHINKDTIPELRQKIKLAKIKWQNVIEKAERGDLINAAFVFAITDGYEEKSRELVLAIAKEKLFDFNIETRDERSQNRDVGLLSLAFDWLYNGLTPKSGKGSFSASNSMLVCRPGPIKSKKGTARFSRPSTERSGYSAPGMPGLRSHSLTITRPPNFVMCRAGAMTGITATRLACTPMPQTGLLLKDIIMEPMGLTGLPP